jgi:hypothetical protein
MYVCLEFPHELIYIPAHIVIVDLSVKQLSFRADYECAP